MHKVILYQKTLPFNLDKLKRRTQQSSNMQAAKEVETNE